MIQGAVYYLGDVTCGLACHDEVARISCRKGTKLSERSGTLADDPFSGRHPTSHERLTGLPWDASYHDGPRLGILASRS